VLLNSINGWQQMQFQISKYKAHRHMPSSFDEAVTHFMPFGFYHTMLCMCGTSHGPVSVCLCLSQVGVLLKGLNVGSQKQHHTIAQEL